VRLAIIRYKKLLYAVLSTKHKIMHYFESHPIRVVTSYEVRKIIGNRLATKRIAKWALELMGLDITYVPQTISSPRLWRILWPNGPRLSSRPLPPPPPVTQEHWNMYFDVSFTLNKAGGGVVLISPKGDRLLYVIQLHFCATNNVVEYEALVNGLRITTKLGVQRLYICGDSNLIANQVLGESNCRDSCMATYRQEVRMLEENIDSFEFHHVIW
jgi:ribonuclease HI